MPTFSSNADVEARIPGGVEALEALTDSVPYSAEQVNMAREKACGCIRALIGNRYQIPADLSGLPDLAGLLRAMELDLVEFELWAGRREDVPARVQKKRDQTWELLVAVSRGQAALPVPAELPPTAAAGTQGRVVGPGRVFTRDGLEGVF